MKRENIRKYYRQLILNEVFSRKTSRVEIAKKYSIRPATVTEIIQELMNEEKIVQTGKMNNKKIGRNRVVLSINPNYKYIIGVYINEYYVYGVVMGFAGNIVKKVKIKNAQPVYNIILNNLNKTVGMLIKEIPYSKIQGIGIASVGVIDEKSGVCIKTSRIKGFNDINLKKAIRTHLKIPKDIGIEIRMAVKAQLLAEKWFGIAVNNDFVVYLQIEAGIAISVVNKGKIYMSLNPSAGLLGHTIIDQNKIKGPNFNSQDGHLEAFLNDQRIIEECNRALKIDPENYLSLDEILYKARRGDSVIIDAIGKFIRYIAIAVANTYNIYGPDHIILGGRIFKISNLLLPETIKMVKKMLIFPPDREDFIKISKLGVFAGSIGATTPFFEEFYSIPEPTRNFIDS
ncbi:MAG: ROK family protein [Spirochaetales bacterium]|nr:ROK family protein [Spirochaetales bacterium]